MVSGPLLTIPWAAPALSRPPLTLRQRLEVDLAPVRAVACGCPCPHLEAIDVAGAQLGHGGRVGLAGQGEGVGFIFCLGVTAAHSLPAARAPRPPAPAPAPHTPLGQGPEARLLSPHP